MKKNKRRVMAYGTGALTKEVRRLGDWARSVNDEVARFKEFKLSCAPEIVNSLRAACEAHMFSIAKEMRAVLLSRVRQPRRKK